MKALAVGLVAVLGIWAELGQVHGAVQWRVEDGGNGHYYTLTDGKKTWAEAEVEAVSLGGHLADILSQSEQDFINDTFLLTGTDGANNLAVLWIGFTDAAQEGTFVWTTGEPVTYTNWHHDEPNGGPDYDEDYTAINWQPLDSNSSTGEWNDTKVEGTSLPGSGYILGPYAGIIELPAVIPEPCTLIIWSLLGIFAVAFGCWQKRWAGWFGG